MTKQATLSLTSSLLHVLHHQWLSVLHPKTVAQGEFFDAVRRCHLQGALWSECPQNDLAAELPEPRLCFNELVLVCSLMMWSGAIARQLSSVVPGSNKGTEKAGCGMLWDPRVRARSGAAPRHPPGSTVTHPTTTHSAASSCSSSSSPASEGLRVTQDIVSIVSPHLVRTRGRVMPAFACAMAFVR